MDAMENYMIYSSLFIFSSKCELRKSAAKADDFPQRVRGAVPAGKLLYIQ